MNPNGGTYTPRPGSKAADAAMHLRATTGGELSTSALAEVMDVNSGDINTLLSVPLREGFVVKVRREGITYWRLGDGTPPATEHDDSPPVQRIVSANGAPKLAVDPVPVFGRSARSKKRIHEPAAPAGLVADGQAAGAAPAIGLRFALWNDGALQITRGGETLATLAADETRELVRYLERMVVEGAA